jgi:hypothetical protein
MPWGPPGRTEYIRPQLVQVLWRCRMSPKVAGTFHASTIQVTAVPAASTAGRAASRPPALHTAELAESIMFEYGSPESPNTITDFRRVKNRMPRVALDQLPQRTGRVLHTICTRVSSPIAPFVTCRCNIGYRSSLDRHAFLWSHTATKWFLP